MTGLFCKLHVSDTLTPNKQCDVRRNGALNCCGIPYTLGHWKRTQACTESTMGGSALRKWCSFGPQLRRVVLYNTVRKRIELKSIWPCPSASSSQFVCVSLNRNSSVVGSSKAVQSCSNMGIHSRHWYHNSALLRSRLLSNTPLRMIHQCWHFSHKTRHATPTCAKTNVLRFPPISKRRRRTGKL